MMETYIDSRAIISSGVEIGQGVSIGPCALIEDHVQIGDGTRIDAFASVLRFTKLGRDNHIYSYACVGGEPQDLKFQGEETWLEIGNRNRIREFATIHRGTAIGNCYTRIGNNNLLMAYTHVAHDCVLQNDIVMSNNASLAGHCEVQTGAILGGFAGVHQFVRIGKYSFVGAVSGLAQDLPPWMLASGNRAQVQSPNMVGLRRHGAGRELMSALKQAFKLVWKSGLPRPDALIQLEAEYGELPEIKDFIEFVKFSQRGITGSDNNC